MKKYHAMMVATLFTFLSVHGQIHLFLEEQEIQMEDARVTAWVFPVDRNLEEVLDDLKDYCKERSDVKMKKEGDNMMIGEKVSIPSIASKRGDLIGYAFSKESYYALALVFQLGYDISVNSKEYEAEMNNFHNYTRALMSYHYQHSYDRRVENLEKEIKSKEKELDQNEKQVSSLNNKIDGLNKKIDKETDDAKIEEYKAEIATLQADIGSVSVMVPLQQTQINQLINERDRLKTESHTYLSTIGTL